MKTDFGYFVAKSAVYLLKFSEKNTKSSFGKERPLHRHVARGTHGARVPLRAWKVENIGKNLQTFHKKWSTSETKWPKFETFLILGGGGAPTADNNSRYVSRAVVVRYILVLPVITF